MGHFSYNCLLSGLPITNGAKATIVVLEPSKYSDYRSASIYGNSSLISNDAQNVLYKPVAYPIRGVYNEYGGLTDIEEDENTKFLESQFNLTIQEIVNILTSGRKDDGYDDDLDKIIESKVEDEETHRTTVSYKEEYRELVKWSISWFRTEIVEELVKNKVSDYELNIDMGYKAMLEYIGFEYKGVDKEKERYNKIYQNGDLIFHSDGRWLGGQVYYLHDIRSKMVSHSLDTTNIDKIMKMDKYEQLYEYVIPSLVGNLFQLDKNGKLSKEVKLDILDYLGLSDLKDNKLTDNHELILELYENREGGSYKMPDTFSYLFMKNAYDKSPLSISYINTAIEEGVDFSKNMRELFTIDRYLYSTGRYYNLVGTSPQDGDITVVKELVKASMDVSINDYDNYHDGYVEEDISVEDYGGHFLKVATKKGYLNVIKDSDVKSFDAITFNRLLCIASANNRVEIVEYLLEHRSLGGMIADVFRISIENNSDDVTEFIINHPKFYSSVDNTDITAYALGTKWMKRIIGNSQFDMEIIDYDDYRLSSIGDAREKINLLKVEIRDEKIDEALN